MSFNKHAYTLDDNFLIRNADIKWESIMFAFILLII